jgi:hypothetical protein
MPTREPFPAAVNRHNYPLEGVEMAGSKRDLRKEAGRLKIDCHTEVLLARSVGPPPGWTCSGRASIATTAGTSKSPPPRLPAAT